MAAMRDGGQNVNRVNVSRGGSATSSFISEQVNMLLSFILNFIKWTDFKLKPDLSVYPGQHLQCQF